MLANADSNNRTIKLVESIYNQAENKQSLEITGQKLSFILTGGNLGSWAPIRQLPIEYNDDRNSYTPNTRFKLFFNGSPLQEYLNTNENTNFLKKSNRNFYTIKRLEITFNKMYNINISTYSDNLKKLKCDIDYTIELTVLNQSPENPNGQETINLNYSFNFDFFQN
ncbi:hypothetical protein ACJA23_02585 [Mycoplasma corogypsi]|uniref:hypothetical protein n=1 Tax=Mycoplasma corogypsi TaxID=2106 RepID=UPI0038730752